MKHKIEISHEELIELLKKALNIDVPSNSIGVSAHCSDRRDLGYGMLDVHSISLSWDKDDTRNRDVWDR